jgi:Multimeric flavodoxin WrbA
MKPEITPQTNLEMLSHYIIDAYNAASAKEKGAIQFHLKHLGQEISCYFLADGRNMVFHFGELERYDVKLTAALYDWLALANNRLNPILGVISQKLKFEGNTKVFDQLIRKDLLFQIKADISDPPTSTEINPVQKWTRPRKILVLNGSPRGRNGYTFHYLNRFIQGMEAAGAAVDTIELGQKKINPCSGCFYCWKNSSGRCIQNDDVNDLYDIYQESDLIIYAFTLYWDTVPGILKNFIERGFCLEQPYMIPGLSKTRHPRRTRKDQSFFVFSVCGWPEQAHFDSVKVYFKNVAHSAHIPFIGGIYRPACMFLPNDPMYYQTYRLVLDSIEQAGASLYQSGKIEPKTIKAIQTEIDPQEFQLHANKYWENVVLKNDYFVKSV